MDYTVLIGAILLMIIFYLIYVYIQNKYAISEVNYKVIFLLGLYLIILSLLLVNLNFTAIGIIFVIIGLLKKNKWQKLDNWRNITAKEKKNKIVLRSIMLIILVILLIFS